MEAASGNGDRASPLDELIASNADQSGQAANGAENAAFHPCMAHAQYQNEEALPGAPGQGGYQTGYQPPPPPPQQPAKAFRHDTTLTRGKCWCGGLATAGGAAPEVDEPTLWNYCLQWGAISDCIVMRGRGFGFVTFVDEASATAFLAAQHSINGRKMDVKSAVPKTGAEAAAPAKTAPAPPYPGRGGMANFGGRGGGAQGPVRSWMRDDEWGVGQGIGPVRTWMREDVPSPAAAWSAYYGYPYGAGMGGGGYGYPPSQGGGYGHYPATAPMMAPYGMGGGGYHWGAAPGAGAGAYAAPAGAHAAGPGALSHAAVAHAAGAGAGAGAYAAPAVAHAAGPGAGALSHAAVAQAAGPPPTGAHAAGAGAYAAPAGAHTAGPGAGALSHAAVAHAAGAHAAGPGAGAPPYAYSPGPGPYSQGAYGQVAYGQGAVNGQGMQPYPHPGYPGAQGYPGGYGVPPSAPGARPPQQPVARYRPY